MSPTYGILERSPVLQKRHKQQPGVLCMARQRARALQEWKPEYSLEQIELVCKDKDDPRRVLYSLWLDAGVWVAGCLCVCAQVQVCVVVCLLDVCLLFACCLFE